MNSLAEINQKDNFVWLSLKKHSGYFVSEHKLPMYLYQKYGLDKKVQAHLKKLEKLHQKGKIKAKLYFEYNFDENKNNTLGDYIRYEYDFPEFEKRIKDGGAIIKTTGDKNIIVSNVNKHLVEEKIADYLNPENKYIGNYECYLCGGNISKGTRNVGYILDNNKIKYCHHRCLTRIDNSKNSLKRLRDYALELEKICNLENILCEAETKINKDDEDLCNYIPNRISNELLNYKVLKNSIKIVGKTTLNKQELEEKAKRLKSDKSYYKKLVKKAVSRYLNLQIDIHLNDENNTLEDVSTTMISKFSQSSLSSALANILLNSKELKEYFKIK